jgi:hypothetical protein
MALATGDNPHIMLELESFYIAHIGECLKNRNSLAYPIIY